MLKLRAKLAQYQEIYYLIFILIMGGLASAGLTSQDRIYQILFAAAAVLWVLKMAVTDYSVKEVMIMAVIIALLGLNFLGNREKTLIISMMAVFGAKNVSLDKVFKYGFFTKAILTAGVFVGVFLGLIENAEIVLPKNNQMITFHCFGYIHPNTVFSNIFMIFLMAMIVYGDKMKWYVYAAVSLVIAATYKLIMCRTGIVVWIVLCLMVLGYKLTKKMKIGKLYRSLMVAMPAVICAFTFILNIICKNNEAWNQKMNLYLTGRITHMNQYMDGIGFDLLGHVPAESFDSMYFHLLYNYGWILFIVTMLAYTAAMWYCNREKRHYELIVLAAMSVYGFMEFFPLSVVWNFSIIYLSLVLFKEKKTLNECLQ